MRWTYKLLIVIYFLTTTQSLALPIGSTVGNADTDQLWIREPANVKAKDLKQSTYRKKAIDKAKHKNPAWNHGSTHQADHILEAQTVSNYLNQHLNGRPLDRNCKLAIRIHLNHPDNLKMVIGQNNQSVGFLPNETDDFGTQNTPNFRFRKGKW
ncbi:hypothetical protein BJ912DRAFT_985454 [Pholiota molesta]|nr:hypothetical protein BJ912DRAFT_985454 [Pholiota molesta]